MKRVLLPALALLFWTATGASAQAPASAPATESSTATRHWLFVGAGAAAFQALGTSSSSDPGIALMVGLGMAPGAHRISLRGVAIAEILGDGVADVALLYGRERTDGGARFAWSAGPGLVFGEDCHGLFGGPCDETSTAVGLAGSVVFSFLPNHLLRPGLEMFANLNSLSSFGGIALVVELGR